MFLGTLAPISNRASWPITHAFEVYDDDSNTVIDVSTADEITIAIRERSDCTPTITASLSAQSVGLVPSSSVGTFMPTWDVAQLHSLCPGTYEIGITVKFSDGTTQIMIGSLPVIDGVVS